jgi:aminopeptidase C
MAPVVAEARAGNLWFKGYKEGILDVCQSGLGHTVLVVGYGEHRSGSYFVIRNSFGNSWGENGYAKVSRECLGGDMYQAFIRQKTIDIE